MKILFCTYHNPHFITISEYVEEAIKKAGWELVSFDDRDFLIPGRLRERAQFLSRFDLNRINKNLLHLVEKTKPDIYLEAGGYRIFPETIRSIGERGIKTVLWTIDPLIPSDPRPRIAPLYDYVFCGGTEMMEALANKNIRKGPYWLPFACDPEIHRRIEITEEEQKRYESDVVFVGSHYPNREKVLEAIADSNLRVFGPGWDRVSPGSPLKRLVRDVHPTPEEWVKIYSVAKIVLVVHYQDGKNPCYQASPKVYEALACKSFFLVDNQKDVKALFADGKHLIIFKGVEDLREKIGYYLVHPEERRRIAEEGYREIIQKHTYLHRFKEMMNTVCHSCMH